MKIEDRIDEIIQNKIEKLLESGTSEGAKKAWQSRRRGPEGPAIARSISKAKRELYDLGGKYDRKSFYHMKALQKRILAKQRRMISPSVK